MDHNIVSKNTGEVELAQEVYADEFDKRQAVLEGIVRRGIDYALLEELKQKPIEERLARLEFENERRIQENVILTLTFASVVKQIQHIRPMVTQLYKHFFSDEGQDT